MRFSTVINSPQGSDEDHQRSGKGFSEEAVEDPLDGHSEKNAPQDAPTAARIRGKPNC